MKILVSIFLVLCSYCSIAQSDNKPMLNNIQGLKIAYITKEMNLSSDEAQKFWPLYYACIDEMRIARKKNADNEIAFEEEALAIKKKYLQQFKIVLGSDERANKVFILERNFASTIRKELEKRRKLRKQGF